MLNEQGIQCLQCGRISEVWTILANNSVSTIVSQLNLPDGCGLEIVAGLSDRNLKIPVIFLTADPIKLIPTIQQAVKTYDNYRRHERRQFAKTSPPQIDPAMRDELTGLASHRFMLEQLPTVYRECCKKGIPVTLCMIDIDGFRQFNSRLGMGVGDKVLIETGRRLSGLVRKSDIVGRYAGDEFLLVLPGSTASSTEALAKRIKENFESEKWEMIEENFHVPLCIGVSQINCDESADCLEFLDRVIEAVYHAKLKGPGSVVTWTPQLSRETSLRIDLGEAGQSNPDYELINIMMWRFRELNRRLTNVTLESLQLLVAAVEARDPYTKHHSVRVAGFARQIAEELNLPQDQIRIIHSAGLLHDIGKIGVPDAILTKPQKLTAEETLLIRQHPAIAVNILEQARFFMAELPFIKHHHEWFNGNGYPDGISGQRIPLGARIIQLADCTEAMLASRSYKASYDLDFTINQLQEGSGKQFDQDIAKIGIRLIQEGTLGRLWKNINEEKELTANSVS